MKDAASQTDPLVTGNCGSCKCSAGYGTEAKPSDGSEANRSDESEAAKASGIVSTSFDGSGTEVRRDSIVSDDDFYSADENLQDSDSCVTEKQNFLSDLAETEVVFIDGEPVQVPKKTSKKSKTSKKKRKPKKQNVNPNNGNSGLDIEKVSGDDHTDKDYSSNCKEDEDFGLDSSLDQGSKSYENDNCPDDNVGENIISLDSDCWESRKNNYKSCDYILNEIEDDSFLECSTGWNPFDRDEYSVEVSVMLYTKEIYLKLYM